MLVADLAGTIPPFAVATGQELLRYSTIHPLPVRRRGHFLPENACRSDLQPLHERHRLHSVIRR